MCIAIIKYIKKHWNGQYSLAWSFWVNFVGLRLLIVALQTWFLPEPGNDYSHQKILIITLILLFHGVVFMWQIVGVLRSAETHLRQTGSQASVWGAQISLVVGLFLTGSYALGAWQTTLPISQDENFMVRMERERTERYELILNGDKTQLSIDGSIELGVTKKVRRLIAENQQIHSVVFNSNGGNIYEARGLAKLFTQNGINTHVETQCSSACTSAFIGGTKRSMAKQAQLGFHQYRIDANYSVLNADPKAEQEKDKLLFRQHGVSQAFIDKMFSAISSEIWFPSPTELLEAGVVHTIND